MSDPQAIIWPSGGMGKGTDDDDPAIGEHVSYGNVGPIPEPADTKPYEPVILHANDGHQGTGRPVPDPESM